MDKSIFVHGVGINDADYPVYTGEMTGGKWKKLWRCPIYQMWSNILARCYNAKRQERQRTYIGCTVAPAWHSFSVFRSWVVEHDWQGKDIDKDILFFGNKVYGPESCVFVDRALNVFFTDQAAKRGELPIGAYWNKRRAKFQAQCRNPFTGKNEYLGLFNSPESAHEAWRRRKHQHALTYADMQTDPRIAKALRERFA